MFKQFILFICVLVLAQFNAKAQFSITVDTLHKEGFPATDPIDYLALISYTKIINNRNLDDTIVWVRSENTFSSTEWTSAVCDINLCWGTNVNTEKFILGANDTGSLSFYFYPKNICGTGKMVVRFSRFSNPSQYVDIVATAKAWCTVGVQNVVKSKPLVFPNPSNGTFTLTSDIVQKGNLNILNTEGKIVSSINYTSGEIVNTNALAKGLYMLNFSDGKNAVNSTLVVE